MGEPEFFFYRGRVGLYVLLKALGIGRGDAVATQAFTCLAVPEAILASGAKPLYIDIGAGSVNMDPEDLRERITPEVRALVVQHTFGIPSDLDALCNIAEKAGVPLIEDCCHTHRSIFNGKSVGRFGVGSFYSHEWGKPVVCGIGGSLVVNDNKLSRKIKDLVGEMRPPDLMRVSMIQAQFFVFNVLYRPFFFWTLKQAFNRLSRGGLAVGNFNPVDADELPTDFKTILAPSLRRRLIRRLKNVDVIANHSRKIAEGYREGLEGGPVTLVDECKNAEAAYARFPVWVRKKADLLTHAQGENIEIAEWYNTPVHPLEGADAEKVGYEWGSCENAERACGRIISLPVHRRVRMSFVDKACRLLNG